MGGTEAGVWVSLRLAVRAWEIERRMRIGLVQSAPVFGGVERNRRRLLDLMGSARADLYVLPELCLSGYVFAETKEVEALSEPADGPSAQQFVEFARKTGSFVVFGFAERSTHLYNSAALVGPDGLVGVYRKVHLFDRERLFFAPGDRGFPVFDLPFGRVGMMICFDWIFPESARSLALRGAQLIAHPSNLVLPHCPDAMVTRCLENRVFAATADRVGRELHAGRSLTFIGTSEVVSPSGEILTRMSRDEEGVALCDVDPAAALQKQVTPMSDVFEGRRPDQYTLGRPDIG